MKGSIRNAIGQGAERLFPGYFALVMATGIVSIGTYFLQISLPIVQLLFQINIVAFSHYSVYVALLAWVIVFAGLIHRILRNLVLVA